PITTIQGALDIHVYDVARVQALAGPQGTLFGASSQAGTIRIITNKPDPSKFEGGVDAEVNKFSGGEPGYTFEGFLNVPLASNIALRAVGYYKADGGYIDNVAGFRTYPTSGIIQSNRSLARRNYNDVDTVGGRLALGIDLDDRWTVTTSLIGQITEADGSFAQQRGLGRWKTQQFNPEGGRDEWFQAALTVEGRVGNWDLTYAGAYLKRKVDGESDYSDYAYFYDALFGYGAYFVDNAGNLVSPNQYIQFTDRYTKQSHELRLTSPAENRLRAIVGLFYQRQTHNIEQNYIIDNIADEITVTGTDSNIWLTKQLRIDRDYAAFGEVTFDITERLKLLGGLRVYHYNNSLVGFFGYAAAFGSTGERGCFGPPQIGGTPCTNVDKATKDTGVIHKL
ncbi:MAG: TonB-dependent receptor, partial [Sphingomonadaceae bacterium]